MWQTESSGENHDLFNIQAEFSLNDESCCHLSWQMSCKFYYIWRLSFSDHVIWSFTLPQCIWLNTLPAFHTATNSLCGRHLLSTLTYYLWIAIFMDLLNTGTSLHIPLNFFWACFKVFSVTVVSVKKRETQTKGIAGPKDSDNNKKWYL